MTGQPTRLTRRGRWVLLAVLCTAAFLVGLLYPYVLVATS